MDSPLREALDLHLESAHPCLEIFGETMPLGLTAVDVGETVGAGPGGRAEVADLL